MMEYPNGDIVLEAAVASYSRYIMPHNLRDFTWCGITPMQPRKFLHGLRSGE